MTKTRHIVPILLTLFLLPAVRMTAQPRLGQPEHYIGVQGGVLASTTSFSPSVEGMSNLLQSMVLNGSGGMVYRYIGHRYVGLQVELDYMQRGWREAWQTGASSGTYTRKLDYVELPLLMHLYFGRNLHRFYINVGPEIGYCFHESEQGQKHPTAQTQYAAIDHPFDWGIAAGIGYYARTHRCGAFELGLRFHYSFGDTFLSRKTAYFDRSAAINAGIHIAYLWELKPAKKKPIE